MVIQLAYDPKHLAWITSKTRLFSFIKPQKEVIKHKKVIRIKDKIDKLRELADDVSFLHERDDDSDI